MDVKLARGILTGLVMVTPFWTGLAWLVTR